jgi:hypothetical protein
VNLIVVLEQHDALARTARAIAAAGEVIIKVCGF